MMGGGFNFSCQEKSIFTYVRDMLCRKFTLNEEDKKWEWGYDDRDGVNIVVWKNKCSIENQTFLHAQIIRFLVSSLIPSLFDRIYSPLCSGTNT